MQSQTKLEIPNNLTEMPSLALVDLLNKVAECRKSDVHRHKYHKVADEMLRRISCNQDNLRAAFESSM